MRRQALRPTPATIISAIALFVALGGTGYALGRHSVGTSQLRRNAVTSSKIRKHAVTRRKLARGAVGPAEIGTDAITGANIAESTLAQVPSAVRAASAESLDAYVPFGIVTAASGEARTLVSYGPFSLIGRCDAEGPVLSAGVVFATTEEHTSFAGESAAGADAGPGTPEEKRFIEDPNAAPPFAPGGASSDEEPGTSDADDEFEAQAPNGRSWAGTVESWASKDADECRWSGYVLKTS